VSKASITKAIGNGKLVVNDRGMIDDQHPANNAQMVTWLASKEDKAELEPVAQKGGKQPQTPANKLRDEKLRLETEKLKEEIEWKKIQNAKANGEVIPTDLALATAAQLGKELGTAYQNAAEKMLTKIAQRYGLDNNDIAFERRELLENINKATEEGVEASLANIENIANEYAVKRGVGEHN